MHDRYKKKFRAPKVDDRARRQIAAEAARRLFATIAPAPGDASGHLREATEAEFYAAKRRAAAVLGRPVRPGDLPSDAEVREAVLELARDARPRPEADDAGDGDPDGPVEVRRIGDHVDRFAVYRLRLAPLESIKQDPRRHPEGDALYHSLQVFDLARLARPFDEEFQLAALLHDVGKAVDARDVPARSVALLAGSIPDRTERLIASFRARKPPAAEADLADDLLLLDEIDRAGRAVGVDAPTIDEALDHLRSLAAEADDD